LVPLLALPNRAIGGDHDDFHRRVPRLQLARERESVAVRQHQVHDGRLHVRLRDRGQRRANAAGEADAHAFGFERETQAIGDRRLVVDDEDGLPGHGAVPWRPADGSRGSRATTRVPCPSTLCTTSSPPCKSTTERAIAMPRPVPSGLVVKKRSKMRASVSSVMPVPVSSKVTVSVFVSAAQPVVTVSLPPGASDSRPLTIRVKNALRSSRASSIASAGTAGS